MIPLPLGTAGNPVRIVVVGSSVVYQVEPPPVTATDVPYPGLLEAALYDAGVVARVHTHAKWHATTKEVLRNAEPWIRDHFPHVVVLNVGFPDTQARVVPTWLYRNLLTWQPGLSEMSVRYRRHVVPHLRRGMRRWQMTAADKVPLRLSRVSPPAFRRALTRLVQLSIRSHRALVLVMDLDGPGPALERLHPGIRERIALYNSVVHTVVAAAASEQVLLLRTSEVVMPQQPELLPDGIHRSAAAHRLVAGVVRDAIVQHGALIGLEPPAGRDQETGTRVPV